MLQCSVTRKLITTACYLFLLALVQCQSWQLHVSENSSGLKWWRLTSNQLKQYWLIESEEGLDHWALGRAGCRWAPEHEGTRDWDTHTYFLSNSHLCVPASSSLPLLTTMPPWWETETSPAYSQLQPLNLSRLWFSIQILQRRGLTCQALLGAHPRINQLGQRHGVPLWQHGGSPISHLLGKKLLLEKDADSPCQGSTTAITLHRMA